jgi:hypothetical protein
MAPARGSRTTPTTRSRRTSTLIISAENSQLASRKRPFAEKSMWSTPLQGTTNVRCSFMVCAKRKSSRCRRSATTIAKRPPGVK